MKINNTIKIIFLGIIHLSIDVVPSFLIYKSFSSGLINTQEAVFLISIYIFLAFGAQFFFGYLADIVNNPKRVIQLGLTAAIFSLLIGYYSLIIAVILIGIANSLIHVGGGIVALRTYPGKATYPGLFVSFGALGLYVGLLLGKTNINAFWYILSLIIILFCFLWFIEMPKPSSRVIKTNISYILPLILILAVIFLRSYLGSFLTFSSINIMNFALLLTLSVFLGKFLGGFIADKFGWLKTVILSLILASILLFFTSSYVIFGLGVLFLFQISMPITLTILGDIFPKNPGFAFGLSCLSIYFGYYFAQISFGFNVGKYFLATGFLLSLIIIFIGINIIFELKYTHEYIPK
ncbi:MAG: hypothetical protein WCP14_00060 [bacterium]